MQEIERPIGIFAGFGLLAAMAAPLHFMPQRGGVIGAPSRELTQTTGSLTHNFSDYVSAITVYPTFARLLAICGTLAICLAFFHQTRWLALIGLIVGGLTGRLAWSAHNAHDLMARIYSHPTGVGGSDVNVADMYALAWGWIAIGVAAAFVTIAGAMAWIDD